MRRFSRQVVLSTTWSLDVFICTSSSIFLGETQYPKLFDADVFRYLTLKTLTHTPFVTVSPKKGAFEDDMN